MQRWLAVALALPLLSSGCVSFSTGPKRITSDHPRNQCVPDVQASGGWLAADGGRSVPLPNGTSIHLFGDTLLGPAGQSDSRPNTYVGNSVGVGECVGGTYRIRYVWRDRGGERKPIFDLNDGKTRLWPVDGFYDSGRLYFILSKIVAVSHGIGFDYDGAVTAVVDNPLADPTAWRIQYRDLVPAGTQYRPDKGITLAGGYANVFSTLVVGGHPEPSMLLRLPLDPFDGSRLEYLARTGQWKPVAAFQVSDAWVVDRASPPNLYAAWHPGLNKWVTVHAAAAFASPNLVLQTANFLWGPWSPEIVVYRFPEMLDPRNAKKGVLCYAATEHPQLRKEHGRFLTVTYACNALDSPHPGLDELDLYRPKTVLIDLATVPLPP